MKLIGDEEKKNIIDKFCFEDDKFIHRHRFFLCDSLEIDDLINKIKKNEGTAFIKMYE
jgi:hypothetical protein